MALSRLLISETKLLRRHPKGFPTPTRWLSSSSSANSSNTAKNESIKTHSGVVEEPFYLIKAINKLKEKVSSSWVGKTLTTSEAHNVKEDRISANTSEVPKTEKELDTAEPDEKYSFQLSQGTDSEKHKSEITKNPTSDIISNELSGDSISSTDSSEKEKIVDMADQYQQSEIDSRTVMALERDQEGAPNLLSTPNGSISGEENGIKGLGVTEVRLTEGKDCSSNMKSMECLAPDACYEQKETSSSCNSVQMTPSNHQKSTGESADNSIDPISYVIKMDERLPISKLDEQIGRHEPSNSAPPVEQVNGYQQYRVGPVRYRGGDQDEAAKTLSCVIPDSASEGKKVTKTVDACYLMGEASTEDGGLPPNKNFVTDVGPNSDSFKKSSWLVDLLDDDKDSGVKGLLDLVKRHQADTLQFSDDDSTNLAKINTPNNGHCRSRDRNEAVVTNKTLKHPDQVKRNSSICEQFVQSKAENQVQWESPMQRRKERSASEVLLTRPDGSVSFDIGHHSRGGNEAVVTKTTLKRPDQVKENPSMSELFMQYDAKNQVQQKSQMERRKERSVSEMLLTKSDDSVLFDNTHSLQFDDDKTNTVSVAAMTAQMLNVHENVSKSGDVALDCKMFKPSPSVPVDSRIKNVQERSGSEMLATRLDDGVSVDNGYHSRNRNEAVGTKEKQSMSELFMQVSDENIGQSQSRMEKREERTITEVLFSESDDDSVLFDNSDSLHSDDDKTNTIAVAAMTARMLNEHGNTSKSDDAALDCKMSKQSPSIPLNSVVMNVQGNGSESDDAALDCKVSKPSPSTPVDSRIKNVHENGSKSDDAASDCRISKQSQQIPLPSQSKSSKKGPKALLLTEKDRILTDILIRFVPKVQDETAVIKAFENCGPIDKIHFISSDKEKLFKNAYVRFKTKEGMRNALSRTDVVLVGNSDILVEALSPSIYTSSRIHPPNLIGIHGVPPSLVKNPTRTVMLKGLTHELSSHHLEYAFSFCGRITGFFMGSSSSVAYIEFETEVAKEKAIEACSILVPGSKLSIFRVDTPCTTVVRIFNAGCSPKVTSICRKYGNVSRIFGRSSKITDVHYAYSEWPSMVNILNSLNGLVVDGQQWSAMPAPVIPVEILQCLWRQPDGRRQVHALFQSACRKIEGISLAEVKDLADKYYEERTETFQS